MTLVEKDGLKNFNTPQSQQFKQIQPNPSESSIERIEGAAEKVTQVLGEISENVKHNVKPLHKISVESALEGAINELKSYQGLAQISDKPLSLYWKHRVVCGPVLSKLTLGNLASLNLKDVLSLGGVGRVRLFGLVDVIKYVTGGGQPQSNGSQPEVFTHPGLDCEWALLLPQEQKDLVAGVFNRAYSENPNDPMPRLLKQLSRVIGTDSLVLMWMSSQAYQRKVAERLGVTESRVSQILKQEGERFKSVLQSEMPQLVEEWTRLLNQPAVDEEVLFGHWFDCVEPHETRFQLGRFFLTFCGGRHPQLTACKMENIWCFNPKSLADFAWETIQRFPITDNELNDYLKSIVPDISISALVKAMGRSAVHVADGGIWFSDRKSAVDYILKQAGRPLTRTEIARALGVKASQTKALLLMHEGLDRIGPNLKRKYALKN